jgi:fermentation-respiration switch protein FrsA (DUF1100 family)
MAYDPMDDLAQIKCPVLAITGEKDIQVNSDDIDRIGATVGGPFNDLTPQNLTHLLRIDTGPASLTSYRDQFNRPVDPDLLATIGAWVTSQVNLGRGPLGKTEKPSTR